MKNLLLTFITSTTLTATPVLADSQAPVLVAKNKEGGEIVLTTRDCKFNGEKYDSLYEAYTWSPTSPYENGCWTIVDDMVHVIYFKSNSRHVYPIKSFNRR